MPVEKPSMAVLLVAPLSGSYPKLVLFGDKVQYVKGRSRFVKQHRLGAGRADVDSQQESHGSPSFLNIIPNAPPVCISFPPESPARNGGYAKNA